jgi:hypothetical protein
VHVSRIELANIRCYVNAAIALSPTINIIAGENNSGKSTVIQALYMLQSGGIGAESIRYGQPNGAIRIFMERLDPRFFKQGARDHIRNGPVRDSRIEFMFNAQPAGGSQTMLCGAQGNITFESFAQSQPDNFIVPYLSDRRSGGYTEQVGAQFAYSVNGTLSPLVPKVDRCLTSEALQEPFRHACKEILGFVVTTYPTTNGKMAGLEIDPRQQQYIPLTRLGSGIGQLLGLIVELLLANGNLFLIEEIENDLHPTALRAVLALVERSATQGNQFVVSTHSNVVVRRLGSVSDARVWRVEQKASVMPPESVASEVANEPRPRRELLQSLGYDLSDYDLYDGWLILEEASAEAIIREFIIPWFAPSLSGRLRTVSAQGATQVEPRFVDLHRLFVFTHLEPIYKERAWVIADGDAAGQEAVQKLQKAFSGWPRDHFQCFTQPTFESYYPAFFGDRVQALSAINDKGALKAAKETLVKEVVTWLRDDPNRGRTALAERTQEVIGRVLDIERAITNH